MPRLLTDDASGKALRAIIHSTARHYLKASFDLLRANEARSFPQHRMAHFLRGKQAGIQRDFSAGIDPVQFAVDTVRRLPLLMTPMLGSNPVILLLLCIDASRFSCDIVTDCFQNISPC